MSGVINTAAGLERQVKNRNIIIRNLSEGNKENIVNKVNYLFKDGLKLKCEVESVERYASKSPNHPGIVEATCKTLEDKNAILKCNRDMKKVNRS